MGNSPSSLNDYLNEFKKFEKFINLIKSGQYNQEEIYEGYFVKKEDYDKFYNFLKEKYNNQQGSNATQNMGNYNMNQVIEEIKSKRINTAKKEVIQNHALNGHEFMLINEDLYKAICFENSHNKVYYKISPEYLIFRESNFSTHIIFQLKNNKDNIINKLSLIGQNVVNVHSAQPIEQVNEKYNVIYKDILNYYKNENEISDLLKINSQKMHTGFLKVFKL